MRLPRTSTVYVAVGVTMLLLCAGVIARIEGNRRASLAYKYEKIQLGMTLVEVRELVGSEGKEVTAFIGRLRRPGERLFWWEREDDGLLHVDFRNGAVIDKWFYADEAKPLRDRLLP